MNGCPQLLSRHHFELIFSPEFHTLSLVSFIQCSPYFKWYHVVRDG